MNKVIQLPYKKDELEPYMSSESIDFHYEKHHKGYMKKLEGLISGTSYESKYLNVLTGKNAPRDPHKYYKNRTQHTRTHN